MTHFVQQDREEIDPTIGRSSRLSLQLSGAGFGKFFVLAGRRIDQNVLPTGKDLLGEVKSDRWVDTVRNVDRQHTVRRWQ